MTAETDPGSSGGRVAGPVVHMFADESCLGNQFGDRKNPGAAAGMIERFDERRGWYRRDFAHFDPDTTNNRMAITSAILGLTYLNRPCRVVFTSDSQYLIKGISEWVHGWARRGWRRKGGEIENLKLWKDLVSAAGRHEIEWRWTRGHADDVKNVYVDQLAVTAAKERRGTGGLVESGFEAWLEEQQDAGRYNDFLDVPDGTFRPGRPPPPAD
ncbi:MAG: ribonuclease H [Gemmatimonadota bacterium]|nr:ribonuclease H [Gemmatimonadota bacterium]